MDDARKISRVVVLGGGTAGLFTALAIKRHLPDIQISVVRSTKMGVIGVGEGTIATIGRFVHQYLGIDSREFHQRVRPSIKLGIRYIWGEHDFFNYSFSPQLTSPASGLKIAKGYLCKNAFDYADLQTALMFHNKVCTRRIDGRPKLNHHFAYHLENESLVSYLEELADKAKIHKIDDIVQRVEQGHSGVNALLLASGQRIEADLFVDCSGFRSELIGKAMGVELVDFSDALFCDRAVLSGWKRTDEPYHPFTTAETMSSGWCWRIEHDETINRGYVYSSAFISDEAAEKEFRAKCPKVRDTRIVKFTSGARRRTWVKNVVAIGNSAGFVEPLEATAISLTCQAISLLVRALQASDNNLLPIQQEYYNRYCWDAWEMTRDFLAVHYKFNKRIDSPFWRAAQTDTNLGNAAALVDYYKAVGPDFRLLNRDMRQNIFYSEGYLSMLVGQGVPYGRRPYIPDSAQQQWRQHKEDLNREAAKGMDMTECLAHLRRHGLPDSGGWGTGDVDMVYADNL